VALITDGSFRSELFVPEFVAAIDHLNKQAGLSGGSVDLVSEPIGSRAAGFGY
jgi:hypothetical protein